MDSSPTPFNAYIPCAVRIDPLIRVYVYGDRLAAVRIGHQFSSLDSPTIQSASERFDQLASNADPAFEQEALLHVAQHEVAALIVDYSRNSHMPASPATIKIVRASGTIETLLLAPNADPAKITSLLTDFYPNAEVIGFPRTPPPPQSPKVLLRQYVALSCFFAVFSIGCVWYSLQQLAHLPILLAVPPNVWGAIHCYRRARVKWSAISASQTGG